MRLTGPDRPDIFLRPLFDYENLAKWEMLPRAVTDKDGQFELRGVGQDRLAVLRWKATRS